jgi:uncharacterized protein (UPF0548 family)
MFFFNRPTVQQIKQFLDKSKNLSLSYQPTGIAKESPPGFKVDEATAVIGHGPETFKVAQASLRSWKQFDLGWVELHPKDAPLQSGTVVAVMVHHLGFWSLNGCRVLYLEEEDRFVFGFAYGTLTNHAELGEEIFEVRLDETTGEVTYRIRAVSKPGSLAPLLGYPYTRMLQDRFRRDSIRAMQRAVSQPRA